MKEPSDDKIINKDETERHEDVMIILVYLLILRLLRIILQITKIILKVGDLINVKFHLNSQNTRAKVFPLINLK